MALALQGIRKRGLPKRDEIVLRRYAMWHPQLPKLVSCRVCGRCSHCSPDVRRQQVIRALHGECHCHPCGGLLPRKR